MWILQLPQTVNRGCIYGYSQNIRELGRVSSFFVMSDWILPFCLMSMGCDFKQTDFIKPHSRINTCSFSHVCIFSITLGMSSESLFHLGWRTIELLWSLTERKKRVEIVLVKLEATVCWIKNRATQDSSVLHNFCKIIKQTTWINRSSAKCWPSK